MSVKLFGSSQILKKDEDLCIIREGVNIDQNVVYVNGKPVKRNSITFKIRGNVQPLGARDLLLVPEGDRFKEQFWIYFNNKAIVTEDNIEIQADSLVKNLDRVVRLCKNYSVQGVQNWGSYSRARIMEIDVGPDKTSGT